MYVYVRWRSEALWYIHDWSITTSLALRAPATANASNGLKAYEIVRNLASPNCSSSLPATSLSDVKFIADGPQGIIIMTNHKMGSSARI